MTLSIDDMVRRRIDEWKRRKAKEGASDGGQRAVITISRSYGARGLRIGRATAERLGLPVYDREIVERIAEQADVRAQVVESVDARVRDSLTDWIGQRFDSGYFTYSAYLDHLTRVVLTICKQDAAVIVGRGAQFFLDPKRTLRVRIVAPLETRIQRIAADKDLDERSARARVMRMDTERASFARLHFAENLSDAEHYDLMINSGAISIDLAAELIATAYRRRFDAD